MKRGIKSRCSKQQVSLASGNAGVFFISFYGLPVASHCAIFVVVLAWVSFLFFFERERENLSRVGRGGGIGS